MSEKPSREERLAAQLRANLRRRKTQARGLAEREAQHGDAKAQGLPKEAGDS